MIGSNHKPLRILGITAGLSVLLSACGGSDLEQLHRDEINAAQQVASEQQPIGSDNEPEPEPSTPNEPSEPGNGGSQEPDPSTPPAAEKTAVEVLLEDYQMVFSDEFNGNSLDANKWNTQYQWGPDLIVNDEEQYYVDSNNLPDFGYNPFSFDGESLIITADRTPADLNEAAKEQSYLSGAMTSLDLFDLTYGYAEIRAKLPQGKGYWPGFWMLGTEFVDRKPQLYIMEHRGDNEAVVYHRYNYSNDEDQFVYSDLLQSTGQNFHDEFHTFGVEWSAGSVSYYVDGEKQHTIDDANISSQDMYFILNLAVGGWFPEAPDATTQFPGTFTIDYIRAYQKP